MSRVLLFGGSGMLGKRVLRTLEACGYDVVAPLREQADVTRPADYMVNAKPDLIINCAGLIPQRAADSAEQVAVNAMAPHTIARIAGFLHIPVVHVSTDCVFRGDQVDYVQYRPTAVPDAIDFYGRTKALGEVDAPHVTNVRTSFIGPEHGLWAWFARQTKVDGWSHAFWTGSTADVVAEHLVKLSERPPGGVVHLVPDQVLSKYEVLCILRAHLNLDVPIRRVEEPYLNRALKATHEIPTLEQALQIKVLV